MTLLIIKIAILNILWIWGFYVSAKVEFHDDENPQHGYNIQSRMILWKLKRWCLVNLGTFYSKPVCTCPICMSSLHGAPFFIAFVFIAKLSPYYLFATILYVVCMAGLNEFISLIVNKLEL